MIIDIIDLYDIFLLYLTENKWVTQNIWFGVVYISKHMHL